MMNRQGRKCFVPVWTDVASVSFFALNFCFLLTYHFALAAPSDSAGFSIDDLWSMDLEITLPHKLLFGSLIFLAFELINFLCMRSGAWMKFSTIPVRGKHLDDFRPVDKLFVAFSKANNPPFTYFFLRYCWVSPNVTWDPSQITLSNTLLIIPFLFVAFDATYSFLHWLLHWQSLYALVHKHHHVQKAPSRANVDAVNVHPIEYILGEYNHLFIVWIVTAFLQLEVHVVAAFLFLVIGGVLAGLNHTRFDVTISIPVPSVLLQKQPTSSSWTNWAIYDSKSHDVHHRIPQSNYGQYTMFWDVLMGSYRPYNPNDMVNPKSQLDPKTGKSFAHGESMTSKFD